MEKNSLKLGQKIKRFRLLNDIRQEDMAEKLEVSRATLINYEKGHTAINVEILNKLRSNYPDFDTKNEINQKPQILVDNTIDFKVLFRAIFEKKAYIFSFTILFTLIGGSLPFFLTKYYNADISLYPAKRDLSNGLGQFQALAANLGINSQNNDQSFNIPDVVKSRRIASKAIERKWSAVNGESIGLISLWGLNTSPWYSLSEKEYNPTIVFEKAIKKFEDHVKVYEDPISGLIKITTTFQDPIIAAEVANFIGNQVELYIQKENSAQSTKEKLFISDRLFIVKNELENAELELKSFKEKNRGYEDSPELLMFFSQLFREVEAKQQVYLTLQQQLELARINEVKQSPILHVLDYAVPPIRKSSPQNILFLISFFSLGLLFSVLSTVFRY